MVPSNCNYFNSTCSRSTGSRQLERSESIAYDHEVKRESTGLSRCDHVAPGILSLVQLVPSSGLEHNCVASAGNDGDSDDDVKWFSCDLGCDVLCALQYMAWDLPTDVGPLYAYEDVVPVALSLVSYCVLDVFESGVQYDIFLDGSHDLKWSDSEQTTWAFAVFSRHHDSFSYHGAMAGRVCCSAASKTFLGAENKTSISAELSAMCWALCWAISKTLKSAVLGVKPQIRFNYDCLLSGGVAFCLWSTRSEPHLAAMIENLALILIAVADVSHEHVKSHVGHPWNHLVDKCCSLIRNRDRVFQYDELFFDPSFANPVQYLGCIGRPPL